MTLGEKIRQVRLERGLTQKQLAGDRIIAFDNIGELRS